MKDIIKKELIGSEVIVTHSKNRSNLGIHGRIIDETKNCLVIQTEKGDKRILKDNIVLEFPAKGVRVEGHLLAGKPEERIKKKVKK